MNDEPEQCEQQVDVGATVAAESRTEQAKAELLTQRDRVIKALAGRDIGGCGEKTSLLGDPEDLEYYVVFIDVGNDLEDAFTDALNQVELTSTPEYDESGKQIRASTLERHGRRWPSIEVLVARRGKNGLRMIREAVLPQVKKANDGSEETVPHKLTGKPSEDLEFVTSCGYMMLERLSTLAQEFYLSDAKTQVVVDYLGNLQKKRAAS